MSEFSQELITKYLPHRYPFLYVDRIVNIDLDAYSAHAVKNVSNNEDFFNGHFPGKPVMPGVVILEALCQSCVILAQHHSYVTYDKPVGLLYFASVDKLKFKKMVVPGDVLDLHVQCPKFRYGRLYVAEAKALVNGEVVCEAVIKASTAG